METSNKTNTVNEHNMIKIPTERRTTSWVYRGIHADVIVYIFAHLHTALHTEENLLGKNCLQVAKELVKVNTRLKF